MSRCSLTLKESLWIQKKDSLDLINPKNQREQTERNRPESVRLPASLTIDRLLVVRVHKVPWVLNGVLEVPDGVRAAALAPQPFL